MLPLILCWWSKLMDKRPTKVIEVELFTDAAGAWRWRLVAANGETLATSEAYSSRGKAEQTAKLIRSSDYEIRIDEASVKMIASNRPAKKKTKPKFPM